MSTLTKRILANTKASALTVFIDKSNVSSDGRRARVLFHTNHSFNSEKQRNELKIPNVVETAFSNVLGDSSRIIPDSISQSDHKNLFYGIISLNSKTISQEDALQENSGFHLVAANIFADKDDNIWTVEENEDGNILIRNESEDLSAILKTRTGANMITAAAKLPVSDTMKCGMFISYLGSNEKRSQGFAIDTSTVFDSDTNKFVQINDIDILAKTEANRQVVSSIDDITESKTSTFAEMSAGQRKSLKEYLTTLYSHAPDFLANYLAVIDKYSRI